MFGIDPLFSPLKPVRREVKPESYPCRIDVKLGAMEYPVYIGTGLLSTVGTVARGTVAGRRAALVTEPLVAAHYEGMVAESLRAAGFQTETLLVPEGEAAKRLSVIEKLYHRALAMGLKRDDLVVALGGGTVGDAAGFFAATYLRGVPFLQLPTTLLAQVDSSVGGKVGVNLDEGKNLVGAFYQPRAVVTDPAALRSLPVREVRAGLAEVIKCGILGDRALFSRLERWPESGEQLWPNEHELCFALSSAIRVKAEVVARDERESGPRMVLNLGHTAGHAVETVTKFGPVRHGEAVAYGLAVATRLAVSLRICPDEEGARVFRILRRFKLPSRREELPARVGVDELVAALDRDKKVRQGRVLWVLPRRIGEVLLTAKVPLELVRECL
ncbi:MAG: 3-dehydroquinate synthase [Bacillota bacterium]|nr:3-dehydroquinate synthase [Bacillota bacterium]